jgi:hypothetical protein
MKVFKISLILIICLGLQYSSLYAQKDYIILKNKDTVFGKVRTNWNGLRTKFKYQIDSIANTGRINRDSIVEYFIAADSSTFVLKKLPDIKKPKYVQWFERGRINLYLYQYVVSDGKTSNTVEYWFVTKANDSLIEIKHPPGLLSQKKEREAFVDLFSDNLDFQKRIKQDIASRYDFYFVQFNIRRYNTEYARQHADAWDYVITRQNDTVLCNLKIDTSYGSYVYQIRGKNGYNKIDSTHISEFFFSFDKVRFKLKALPGQNQSDYVRCLENGPINLYELIKASPEQGKLAYKYSWYVNKGEGPLMAIKTDANKNYDIRQHKECLKAFRSIIADHKDFLDNFNYELNYAAAGTDKIIRSYIITYNKEFPAR